MYGTCLMRRVGCRELRARPRGSKGSEVEVGERGGTAGVRRRRSEEGARVVSGVNVGGEGKMVVEAR